jgi:hypothetical protein
MDGIPETVWLNSRGPQSVRLVRAEAPDDCRLFVYGPETDTVTYDLADVTECMRRQAEIEQRLLAA